jgi:hypothetical protein
MEVAFSQLVFMLKCFLDKGNLFHQANENSPDLYKVCMWPDYYKFNKNKPPSPKLVPNTTLSHHGDRP